MGIDVVSLGEAMVEFNPGGPGPLRDVEVFRRGWGGDTSNVAIAATRLGASTGYITRIGDDDFGACLLGLWRSESVDTSRVVIEKGGYTGIYFLSIAEGGEWKPTYFRRDSAASHLSPRDLDLGYIKGAKIFHTSGISQAVSVTCREAAFEAARAARGSGTLVSYDFNVRLKLWPVETARSVIQAMVELTDIATPSLSDAKLIFGDKPARDLAEEILREGVGTVAIKMGAEGCLIATRREALMVPAFKVQAIDTAGSGDAFDGALLVGLLEGWDMKKAARFANAAAALKCLGQGAVGPLPRRGQVEAFLKEHEE